MSFSGWLAGFIDPPSATQPAGAVAQPEPLARTATLEPGASELERVAIVREELAGLAPWGPVTAEVLAALREHYDERWGRLAAPVPASTVSAAPPLATAVGPSTPSPSMREFLADRSILLLGSVGAFLLIVAAVLFDGYAAASLPPPARLGGILVLNLAFGAAAWIVQRFPTLRIVGTPYLAIFALTTPLVLLAAYVFLSLEQVGLRPATAVALGGTACALLYGTLGVRLRSQAYALLGLLGFGVAWAAAAEAAAPRGWQGVALAWLAVACAGVPSFGPRFARLARYAPVAALLTGGSALAWTLSVADSPGDPGTWPWPATLLVLATAALISARTSGSWNALWLAAPAAGLAIPLAVAAADLRGLPAVALQFVIAVAFIVPAARLPSPAHAPLQITGAALAATAWLWPEAADAVRAAASLGGAILAVYLARTGGKSRWILLAAVLFSVAWHWLLAAAVQQSAQPTRNVVLGYCPLPILFVLAAVGLARAGDPALRAWRRPLYGVASAAGLILLAVAADDWDEPLLAGLLLTTAALGYCVVFVERHGWVLAPVAIAGILGGMALLESLTVPPVWRLPVATLAAWGIWAVGLRGPGGITGWREIHRRSGLTLAALAAAGSFAFSEDAPGANVLAGLLTLWGFALLLFVDSITTSTRNMRYFAAVTVSITGAWIAAWAGASNPQWYVAAPGLGLLGAGLLAGQDRQLQGARRLGRALVIGGAFLLLGTSGAQAFDEGEPFLPTALLTVESVVGTVTALALRHRTLAVASAAGLALAALRALVGVLTLAPLFLVFGGLALLLLVGAAALALLRPRIATVRTTLSDTWTDWS